MPEISLIIPTYRRPDDLETCLESVFAAPPSDMEVIVVDDGSPAPGLPAELRERYPRVQWVMLPGNTGPSGAQAAGARAARGEILAFLDDDAVALPSWPEAIRQFFLAHSDMQAVVGRILPLDPQFLLSRMRQQIYDKRHRAYTDPAFREDVLRRFDLKPASAPYLSDHLSGGNCALRRAAYEAAAPPPGPRRGGDNRLADRLLNAGHAIGYNPEMVIRHRHFHGYRLFAGNCLDVGRARAAVRRSLKAACADAAGAPFRFFRQRHLAAADRNVPKVYLAYLAILLLESAGELHSLLAGPPRSR